MTRTARNISNVAANTILFSGGDVVLTDSDDPAKRYRIQMPKAAKWIYKGAYSLDGWTIHFLPCGSVTAHR